MPPKDKLPILNARKEWDCPNCAAEDVTEVAQPHTRFHNCAGMGGLSLPMVEKARRARRGKGAVRVRKALREDYVGKEKGLVYDEQGQPVMAAVTEYPDGSNDVAVFAPVVRVEMRH
jgi:hypothetical protein